MARVEEGWQNEKENMKPTKAGSGVGTPHPPGLLLWSHPSKGL